MSQKNIFSRLQGPLAVSDIYDKVAELSAQVEALKTAPATTTTTTINNTTTVTDITGASGQASVPQFAFIPNLTTVPSNNPTTGAPYAQNGLLIQVGRNFYVYVGAPTYQWIPVGVTESGIANCEWLTSVAGTNTITAITSQAYTALASGFLARIIPAHTNTGAVTLNVNSIGASAVTKYGSVALSGGELVANTAYLLLWDGTQWQILGAFAVLEAAVAAAEWAVGVAGTNTITCTTATAYTSFGSGFLLRLVPANTNTGAATIAVNGITAVAVTKNGSIALTGGELIAGQCYLLMWDGTRMQIVGQMGFGGSSGSFTPVISFGGASVGVTYSVNAGQYYTDAGGMIHATLQITLSSKGTSTGAALISGLPATAGAQWEAMIEATSMSGLTGSMSANVQNGTSEIQLSQWGATGVAAVTDTVFTNTSSLNLSFVYHA